MYAAAVVFNVLMLGYYKYTGFLLGNLAALGMDVTVPSIALPAGISFFTFQAVAYLTDVYRGAIPAERNLGRVTLFMAFFPQLLQGPILRYGEFGPEILQRRETADEAADGAVRFCFGLAKKVLLADALGQVADGAFSAGDQLTVSLAWLGAVAYTLQLYFDFSGYTDMAIGLGRVFGFHLPENFNYPTSPNPPRVLAPVAHDPLLLVPGLCVHPPGRQPLLRGRHLINLLVVWLLTGLWHGSAWNFVLWGLYYAALLVGEKFLWGKTLQKLPGLVQHVYALVLIIVGWVLFRSGSLTQVGEMVSAMFGAAPGGLWSGESVYYLRQFAWEWAVAFIAAMPVKNWLSARLEACREAGSTAAAVTLAWGVKLLAFVLLGWSVVRILSTGVQSFLYFQF